MARKTRTERLAEKVAAALQGRASRVVRVSARLSGPTADAWTTLQASAQPLGLDDADLLALLVDHGFGPLSKALQQANEAR